MAMLQPVGAQESASHRLVVEPKVPPTSPHGCPLCPANLCKVRDSAVESAPEHGTPAGSDPCSKCACACQLCRDDLRDRRSTRTGHIIAVRPCCASFVEIPICTISQIPAYNILSFQLHLSQGQELQALRQSATFATVVYAGDGANDLCPALALGPEDHVVARSGYALQKLIERRAGGKGGPRVEAQVRVFSGLSVSPSWPSLHRLSYAQSGLVCRQHALQIMCI